MVGRVAPTDPLDKEAGFLSSYPEKVPSVDGGKEPTICADLLHWDKLDAPRQYTPIRRAGSGAFGDVYIADWHSSLPSGAMVPAMQHSYTRPAFIGKRIVAIKRCRFPMGQTRGNVRLNELRALRSIPSHPHVIALYDVFREQHLLHIVFECMEGNLYQLIKSRKGLPIAPGLVASIAEQMFQGIAHVHAHGFFHRDMKPENVLITTLGLGEYPVPGSSATRQDVLVLAKVADFGLARTLASRAPYTDYIATRWYRAPEILLRSGNYSAPIDVWALAVITAEMMMLEPLFAGANELDQLHCIVRVLGSPIVSLPSLDQNDHLHYGGGVWNEAQVLAERLHIKLPEWPPVPLEPLLSSDSYPMLVDLLSTMLRYDPRTRATMQDCLKHPFFTGQMAQLQPIRCMMPEKAAKPMVPIDQSPPEKDSPAMSMESNEHFFKPVDELSLSTSEEGPVDYFISSSSSSLKSPDNEETCMNSNKFSDGLQFIQSRFSLKNFQKICSSRTSSPILWVRQRHGSPSTSTHVSDTEDRKSACSSEPASYHDDDMHRTSTNSSPTQSRSLSSQAGRSTGSMSRKDPSVSNSKQAERLRREEETAAMRERARAVMLKRQALLTKEGTIDDATRVNGWTI